jgi:hypothetical protein
LPRFIPSSPPWISEQKGKQISLIENKIFGFRRSCKKGCRKTRTLPSCSLP